MGFEEDETDEGGRVCEEGAGLEGAVGFGHECCCVVA